MIAPFRSRLRKVLANEQKAQADRGQRKAEQAYQEKGYGPEFAEKQAGVERELADAIKRRRGLKGITLTGASN